MKIMTMSEREPHRTQSLTDEIERAGNFYIAKIPGAATRDYRLQTH